MKRNAEGLRAARFKLIKKDVLNRKVTKGKHEGRSVYALRDRLKLLEAVQVDPNACPHLVKFAKLYHPLTIYLEEQSEEVEEEVLSRAKEHLLMCGASPIECEVFGLLIDCRDILGFSIVSEKDLAQVMGTDKETIAEALDNLNEYELIETYTVRKKGMGKQHKILGDITGIYAEKLSNPPKLYELLYHRGEIEYEKYLEFKEKEELDLSDVLELAPKSSKKARAESLGELSKINTILSDLPSV